MTQEDLEAAVHRRPFEPFQLVLSTGEAYEVRHPELLMVGRRSAIIGISSDPNKKVYDQTFKVDLLHIVGIKDLPVHPPSANGPTA